MRRTIVLVALMFAAAPLAAQQQATAPEATPAVETAAPQAAPAAESKTPTLHVSRDQIDAQLQAEPKANRAAMDTSFWYTVAAVALGVIIALLLID